MAPASLEEQLPSHGAIDEARKIASDSGANTEIVLFAVNLEFRTFHDAPTFVAFERKDRCVERLMHAAVSTLYKKMP